MTKKVYLNAPKCTFNPDPLWDQNWNYIDLWENFFPPLFQEYSFLGRQHFKNKCDPDVDKSFYSRQFKRFYS